MAFATPSAYLQTQARVNPVTPTGAGLVMMRFDQDVDVAETEKGVIGILPAGTVPVMVYVRTEALDTIGALVWDLGLDDGDGNFSTASADGGKWLTGATQGRAATFAALDIPGLRTIQPSDKDRKILFQITTAGDTAGTFGIDLIYGNGA